VTPSGFLAGASLDLLDDSIITGDAIKSRFYSTGPTYIFNILDQIDGFISGVNTMSKSQAIPCLAQDPVEYDVTFAGASPQAFYAQCYSVGSPTDHDPQLRQFGVKDGKTYLYSAWAAERVAAIVTPSPEDPSKLSVQAWIGIGYNNTPAFDSGSYGVFELTADESTGVFEMTVAGIGFGYCGIQLNTDGTNVYAVGSNDMGATCTASNNICVDASDLTTAGTCSASLQTFLLPALGRKATSGAQTDGASGYPATPNVTLDGSTTDDLWFGPTTPTSGVGNMMAGAGGGTGSGTDTGSGTGSSSGTGTGTGTGTGGG
jgi:hypothetical protein